MTQRTTQTQTQTQTQNDGALMGYCLQRVLDHDVASDANAAWIFRWFLNGRRDIEIMDRARMHYTALSEASNDQSTAMLALRLVWLVCDGRWQDARDTLRHLVTLQEIDLEAPSSERPTDRPAPNPGPQNDTARKAG